MTRSSVSQAQFLECRSSETRCLRLLMPLVPEEHRRSLNLDRLTGRYQDTAIAHELAHELGSIATPIWNRSSVIVQMALPFIRDVEGENAIREIFPFRRTFDQRVGVLQDVGDTILEIRDA